MKPCHLVKQYVIERLMKGSFPKRSVNIHMTEHRAWSYVIIKISTVITIPVTIIFHINITGTLCTFNAAHREVAGDVMNAVNTGQVHPKGGACVC